MNLTIKQKVLAGGAVAFLIGFVIYLFIKKDTPTPTPTGCANADKCNKVLYEWIVDKKWAFNNSASAGGAFTDCVGCKNISFKEEGGKLQTSKDGGNTWKEHISDRISAYNEVKEDTSTGCANADKCNKVLYEWIVNNKWLFNNSASAGGAFTDCGGCKNISFKEEGGILKTSKDGGNTWKEHVPNASISAYNEVKE